MEQLIEQLRDIYCGRQTYNTDNEWIENLDSLMEDICELQGLDFSPQVDSC